MSPLKPVAPLPPTSNPPTSQERAVQDAKNAAKAIASLFLLNKVRPK